MHNVAILVVTLLCLASCAAAPPADKAPPTLSDAYAAVFQGEGLRAVEILEALDPAALSEKHRDRRACLLGRLRRESTPPRIEDAFFAATFDAYQEYWLRALRSEQAPAEAEAWLLGR